MESNSGVVYSQIRSLRTHEMERQLQAVSETFKKIEKSLGARPYPHPPRPHLLGLPFELRLNIYHYIIPRRCRVNVSWPSGFQIESACSNILIQTPESEIMDLEDAPDDEAACLSWEDGIMPWEGLLSFWNGKEKNAIFRVSKQISSEALDVLYGENIFIVQLHGEGEYHLSKLVAETNRQRMRYLLLVAEPQGVSYTAGRMPDSALWSSILPTLKELRLVARQPVEAAGYYGAPTLEEDMQCWVKWIKPFLRCFGRHLSKDTVVSLDIDGRPETRDLVKDCLPHGYREVECHIIGDLIFKRGRFSWESGYWDEDERLNSRDGEWDLPDSD